MREEDGNALAIFVMLLVMGVIFYFRHQQVMEACMSRGHLKNICWDLLW
jgi:preprotein translocase subunit YajC